MLNRKAQDRTRVRANEDRKKAQVVLQFQLRSIFQNGTSGRETNRYRCARLASDSSGQRRLLCAIVNCCGNAFNRFDQQVRKKLQISNQTLIHAVKGEEQLRRQHNLLLSELPLNLQFHFRERGIGSLERSSLICL